MNFLKTFLKKYSALILPASLLIAGILVFIPTLLVGKTVKSKMQISARMAQELDTQIRNVPSIQQADRIRQAFQQFEKEVQTVDTMALDTTRRELIKYGVFPKPNDSSSQIYIDFGKRYRAAIENLITNRLKALDAPSDSEIKARSGQTVNPMYPALGGEGMYAGGMGMGQPAQQSPMVDALCLERARKITTYANPRVLAWYDFWDSYQYSGSDQALKDCWFAQAAYWIYEDVVSTIETMNSGSTQVADSPVKRLLGVSFQRPVPDVISPVSGPMAVPLAGLGSNRNADLPIYIQPGRPSPLVSTSLTVRAGNEELDVVHFAVSVIVDNRSVQAFVKELCSTKPHTYREGFEENGKVHDAQHNQITVLQSSFSSVDKQDPMHAYYRYGTAAVMRVDLVCEYLFYRQAYDVIKPEPVKIILGQSDQVPAANSNMSGVYR